MFTHVQCCDIVPSLVSSFGESLDIGLYFAPQLPRSFDHFYEEGRGGEPPPPHSAGRGGEPPPPRGAGRPSLEVMNAVRNHEVDDGAEKISIDFENQSKGTLRVRAQLNRLNFPQNCYYVNLLEVKIELELEL